MLWRSILASSIVLICLILLMVLIYYFVSRKGIKQQKEHFKQLHQELAVGQKVQFSNGIYGVLKKVGTETVDIQVKSGAVMEVSRYGITEIVNDKH